jgi:hypothetical protein
MLSGKETAIKDEAVAEAHATLTPYGIQEKSSAARSLTAEQSRLGSGMPVVTHHEGRTQTPAVLLLVMSKGGKLGSRDTKCAGVTRQQSPEFNLSGQVGQESHLHPAILEPRVRCNSRQVGEGRGLEILPVDLFAACRWSACFFAGAGGRNWRQNKAIGCSNFAWMQVRVSGQLDERCGLQFCKGV